ncbi:efflux RND transporter permease subunit [Flavobacterium sp. MAH-1]|uniref:Efflux RND transporter permease subunit n=1 Tax=Flavobacterium agri TaxID=2743471 RepID=A0A7Y8Y0Y9_9FLAO|nr:efflux RND transporter permease subunit [Flavobacterium agri]NUY80406.1 efflux RND transporter permease subunit [Flavobacterium agri]NYA70431.1 efflux RND transporter permease subunit [Flavobacterium agri]
MINEHHDNKEFSISSWAVDNRVTVYIFTFIIVLTGIMAYITMPREDFPEIIENKIYVSSVFPGNSSEDVEKLVVKPLEDEIKNISGVTKVTSSSFQDYGMIVVEFDEKVKNEEAKARVKDKVDLSKADSDWPNLDNGSKVEPSVFDLNISEEVPILNINLQGNYTAQQLKKYGEYLEDEIEDIPEIKQVDILGVDDREVEIALDVFKMNAAKVSFDDVERAVKGENVTLSGGNLITQGFRNNIRIVGEIDKPIELENVIVKSQGGNVLLKDIAKIEFKEKERTTYARESGDEVVMLSVKKRSRMNMIDAIDKTREVIKEAQEKVLPKDLKISMTNDQSSRVEHQVDELSNHIIFGIILVMIVLMFTMGLRNSLFVGAAIPLSMLMAFGILNAFGVTLNTMVLFALVMGLGMLVDDGIVVVDNVFANMKKGMDRIHASKIGIGEIAWPVISSTATTLAAFFPLGLWPGTMGKFMFYFPMTLSVVLGASLFVAMIINASMTAGSMDIEDKNISKKTLKFYTILFTCIAIVFLVLGNIVFDSKGLRAIGNLSVIAIVFMWLYRLRIFKWTQDFQHSFFPRMEARYQNFLAKILHGKRPFYALFGIIGLLFLSFVLLGIFPRQVLFFPDNIPNQAIVYLEYPQGTDIDKTDKTTKFIERQVIDVMKKYVDPSTKENFLAESIVSQVGMGASNPNVDAGSQAETPYKGKVTINFREFKFRRGVNTADILEEVRDKVKLVPGAKITVEKDAAGPASGYPISVQLTGTDYDEMLVEADKLIAFINSKKIPGIEKLQVDINKESPELEVKIDRVNAGSLGTSTGAVGYTMRRALYGQEISTYKEGDDDYDITMRLQEDQRKNESVLFNQPVTFTNNRGEIIQVPISAVATSEKTTAFNQIKRKDYKRIMTVYSNLITGYNADAIMKEIGTQLKDYKFAGDVTYSFSGEQEEQAKNQSFLFTALLLALFGIMTIIVLQFNSVSKTLIIMFTVLLSFSGVFYGYVIAGMDFVILMTMMGIISLAGVVVKNGIVLMDFFVLLLDQKVREYDVKTHDDLPLEVVKEVIIESGKSRLRPVLLTALTAVLGLIPLAIGLNFDFFSLITDLNPHVFIGGDNVIFWGPLAWTIIFGLTYATVLTLVMVPVMFYLVKRTKYWLRRRRAKKVEIATA